MFPFPGESPCSPNTTCTLCEEPAVVFPHSQWGEKGLCVCVTLQWLRDRLSLSRAGVPHCGVIPGLCLHFYENWVWPGEDETFEHEQRPVKCWPCSVTHSRSCTPLLWGSRCPPAWLMDPRLAGAFFSAGSAGLHSSAGNVLPERSYSCLLTALLCGGPLLSMANMFRAWFPFTLIWNPKFTTQKFHIFCCLVTSSTLCLGLIQHHQLE